MPDPDVTEALARLVDLMARLRAPGGCPWDREQTHATLRPYLLEEAYEVLDAIERGDPAAAREAMRGLLGESIDDLQNVLGDKPAKPPARRRHERKRTLA